VRVEGRLVFNNIFHVLDAVLGSFGLTHVPSPTCPARHAAVDLSKSWRARRRQWHEDHRFRLTISRARFERRSTTEQELRENVISDPFAEQPQ
jgi:hypothetical protein